MSRSFACVSLTGLRRRRISGSSHRQAPAERRLLEGGVCVSSSSHGPVLSHGIVRFVFKKSVLLCLHNLIHFISNNDKQFSLVCRLARRWYRRLEYTTNVKLCLHSLQPNTADRRTLWPKWGRHEAFVSDIKPRCVFVILCL